MKTGCSLVVNGASLEILCGVIPLFWLYIALWLYTANQPYNFATISEKVTDE